MRLVNVRVWQWVLIGVILGGVIAEVRIRILNDFLAARAVTGESLSNNAVWNLLWMVFPDGKRVMQDVVIYPGKDDKGKEAYYVACLVPEKFGRMLDPKSPGLDPRLTEVNMVPARFLATKPMVFPQQPADPNRSIFTVLEQVNKERPRYLSGGRDRQTIPADLQIEPMQHRYATWYEPNWIRKVWGGGTVVLVGVIWPLIIRLLIWAGLAPKPERKGAGLFWYKSKGVEKTPMSAGPGVTGIDQLKALEAQLEARLAKGAKPRGSQPSQPEQPSPVAPLKLDAKPIEPPKPVEKTKEEKAFGLKKEDFYPTEVHGKPPKQ